MQNNPLSYLFGKLLGFGVVLLTFTCAALYAPLSVAAENECGELVDMADSGDFDSLQKCEASERGLNKAFQRLFTPADGAAADAEPVPTQQTSARFSSATSLASVRFQLLKQAAKSCNGAFVVEKEKYSFDGNNGDLVLVYGCDSTPRMPSGE